MSEDPWGGFGFAVNKASRRDGFALSTAATANGVANRNLSSWSPFVSFLREIVMVAPRAAWRGFLKVGSVSCGVKIVGVVTEAEKIHFKVLNRKTGNTVRSIYVDEETNDEVQSDQQMKGWEADKGDYVQIDPDEIQNLKLSSEHTLEVGGFVPIADIDTRYLEKPYYMIPADKPSAEAFIVLRLAMEKVRMAARSCVVMYRRGHEVVI